MEQNFGSHMKQKCATLCAPLGSVVAQLRRRMALSEVGGRRRDLLGDLAFLDVVGVGQAEMLLRHHVAAEHAAAGFGRDIVEAVPWPNARNLSPRRRPAAEPSG
jgi:hypothetical protein